MGIDAVEHLVEVLHVDEGFNFNPPPLCNSLCNNYLHST